MHKTLLLLSLALFSTGCDETCKGSRCGVQPVPDTAPPADTAIPPPNCNVLTQAGCEAGEKCTWFEDDMSSPPIGHIGCAPQGDKAIGAACTTGAPGATGFDDCVGGSVCVGGVCEAICDHQGGTPACAEGFGCVRISGLFGPAMSTEPPAAGVCEPSCDPIADNDFDGSGAASTRTGSACGSDVRVGCYGNISDSGDRTHFICAPPAQGTETLVHRNVIPANLQYLNACHPGYTIAFGIDATGSTNVDCYSFCAPGNSYMGSATHEPNGKPGHQCRVASSGRTGNFGAIATETTNGEHCMYSWLFEVTDAGTIRKSPTSDTVGICWDHSKYQIDHDQMPSTPTIAIPPCGQLPLNPMTGLGAESFGCVDSTLSGATIERRALPFIVPAFAPEYGGTLARSPR